MIGASILWTQIFKVAYIQSSRTLIGQTTGDWWATWSSPIGWPQNQGFLTSQDQDKTSVMRLLLSNLTRSRLRQLAKPCPVYSWFEPDSLQLARWEARAKHPRLSGSSSNLGRLRHDEHVHPYRRFSENSSSAMYLGSILMSGGPSLAGWLELVNLVSTYLPTVGRTRLHSEPCEWWH